METAIQVIWWIGLIGALVVTLVVLKQVSLVLRSLRGILRLATYTRDAARGVGDHTAAVSRLAGLHEISGVRAGAEELAAAAASVDRKLDALEDGARP